ncbi:class I lanthipeptide [Chryseobacterium oncorhynchi]|uniref:class I lanthipeptide n=1 Tax=Chryseobacterium oncorhynchi TaxID=741074 RepID=UPI000F4DFFDE|nr:class I lanthipeptide [Chryseobacterium oncorhynchi]
MKKQPKLGKKLILNKDTITRLQEDQLNKLKGGIKDGQGLTRLTDGTDPEETSFSCLHHTCNKCI